MQHLYSAEHFQPRYSGFSTGAQQLAGFEKKISSGAVKPAPGQSLPQLQAQLHTEFDGMVADYSCNYVDEVRPEDRATPFNASLNVSEYDRAMPASAFGQDAHVLVEHAVTGIGAWAFESDQNMIFESGDYVVTIQDEGGDQGESAPEPQSLLAFAHSVISELSS